MENTKENKEQKINEACENIVRSDILCSINLTIEKELKENPELITESKNYDLYIGKEEKLEIFEYWAVENWLAKQLEKQGEIIFDCLDFIVWGRQCTGQAISMDGVIKDIAKNCS